MGPFAGFEARGGEGGVETVVSVESLASADRVYHEEYGMTEELQVARKGMTCRQGITSEGVSFCLPYTIHSCRTLHIVCTNGATRIIPALNQVDHR